LHILQLKFVKTVEALVLNGKRKNDNKFSGYTKHSMVHKHYSGGYRWWQPTPFADQMGWMWPCDVAIRARLAALFFSFYLFLCLSMTVHICNTQPHTTACCITTSSNEGDRLNIFVAEMF